MQRIKYELYVIRDVFRTMRRVFKVSKSARIRSVLNLFLVKGKYTDFKGNIKEGSYYAYIRDFWFGETK